MGQEVVYCFKCGTRLKGSEFEKGSAFKIGDKTCCATCAVGLLASLPAEEQQAILNKVMSNESSKKLVVQGEVINTEDPNAPKTPTPSPRNPEGTTSKTKLVTPRLSRVPVPGKPTQRSGGAPPADESKSPWMIVAAGVVLAAILGLFLALGGSRGGGPAHRGPSHEVAEEIPLPPPVEHPKPEQAPPPTASASKPANREASGLASLEKAREYSRANPVNLSEQIKLYQQAVWEAEGTSHFETVKKELAPLLERQKDQFTKEFADVDRQSDEQVKKEEFRAALETLDKARKAHPELDWTHPIDKKSAKINSDAIDLFKSLKDNAVSAKREGKESEAQAIVDRVSRWGLDALTSELHRDLAGVSAPAAPPKVEDEGPAYKKAWEAAITLASNRAYSKATKELEAAAGIIQDGTLKGEALQDVENIRMVRTLYIDTKDALSEWPDGRKLSLKYIDEAGAKKSVNDPTVKSNYYRAEFRKSKTATFFVEFSDCDAASLLQIYRDRKGKTPNAKAMAYFAIFEGDTESAKIHLGEAPTAIPQKYWDYAKRVAEARAKAPKPDPETVKKDREARELLYSAEKEFTSLDTRDSAVAKYQSLLNNFGEAPFVKRNHEFISRRADGLKEYVFFAQDLKGAGTLKLTKDSTGRPIWASDSDSEQNKRRDNYVDIDFIAEPGVVYRCYVLLGGCCIDTMSFFMQGTEMAAMNSQGQPVQLEPGGTTSFTVRLQSPGGIPEKHADHGGAKQTSRFVWSQVRIPVYASGGVKKIRIMTDQQGFALARVVISANQFANRGPGPADMRQFEHDR